MRKKQVLFISTHNSCRSQIAEAYLNTLAGDRFEAMSAGLSPSAVEPIAVEIMKEEGIDISSAVSKSAQHLKDSHKFFNYVIKTCGKEMLKDVPVFPGADDKICWNVAGNDYSGISQAQKTAITRKIRDEIRANIIKFINLHS